MQTSFNRVGTTGSIVLKMRGVTRLTFKNEVFRSPNKNHNLLLQDGLNSQKSHMIPAVGCDSAETLKHLMSQKIILKNMLLT